MICTEEVEYITSFDNKWWLRIGEIPRICILEELIRYLESENLDELVKHPCFLHLNK